MIHPQLIRELRRQRGLSYTEVLIATLLIAMALLPAMDSLMPATRGSAMHQQQLQNHHALRSRMEQVLAEPFTSLDSAATDAGGYLNPSSYSDAPGDPMAVFVYLSRYDVDNADGDNDSFSGGEDDLLWVRVELEQSSESLETLVSVY